MLFLIIFVLDWLGATWKWRNSSKYLCTKKASHRCSTMVHAKAYTLWKETSSTRWKPIHVSVPIIQKRPTPFIYPSVSSRWYDMCMNATLTISAPSENPSGTKLILWVISTRIGTVASELTISYCLAMTGYATSINYAYV